MKNKISDLRDHMFAQLERLGNENLTDEELKAEIERGKAISEVGKVIVESAKTEVLYAKLSRKKDLEPRGFLELKEDDSPKGHERPKPEYSNRTPYGLASGTETEAE